MKLKYDLQHDDKAYRIDSINDWAIRISARILASKIVRKNYPIQCTSGVIACAQQCAKQVQVIWSLFLLNQFTDDVVAAQAGERPFTYSWLLILIALVAWMELVEYQGMEVEAVKVCKGARYQNLWWVEEPSRKEDYMIHFWVYEEALQEASVKVS